MASTGRRILRGSGLSLLLLLSSMSALADEEWVYTLRPGDNLWDLTQRYLVSVRYWRPLQRLNRIADPLHMRPGSRLRMPKRWSRVREVGARVVGVQGQARIVTGGGTARPARKGDLVRRGDRLSTPDGSSLMLEFSDGTRLLLREGSDLEMQNLEGYGDGDVGQTGLNMSRGGVETRANPKKIPGTRFEITTPSALTAVRGTYFRLAVAEEGRRSRVEVIEGRVRVAGDRRSLPVTSGFGIVAGSDTAARPRRLPAAPLGLPVPRVVEEVSFSFTAAEPGIVAYRVQIATSRSLTTPVYDRLFPAGRIDLDVSDLADGPYVLKIRAVADDGLEGGDALYDLELNTRPPAPVQLTPPAGSRGIDPMPVFTWARPEGSGAYHFQLATDPGMTRLLLEQTRFEGERLSLEQPLPSGRYYWRVTALDPEGKPGPEGLPREFRILPRAPDQEPAALDPSGITFQWRPGRSGQGYRFQLAADAEFTRVIEDVRTDEDRYHLTDPRPGTYFMRVKTIDEDGTEGPFGRVQSVEVPAPERDLGWLVLVPAALMVLLSL